MMVLHFSTCWAPFRYFALTRLHISRPYSSLSRNSRFHSNTCSLSAALRLYLSQYFHTINLLFPGFLSDFSFRFRILIHLCSVLCILSRIHRMRFPAPLPLCLFCRQPEDPRPQKAISTARIHPMHPSMNVYSNTVYTKRVCPKGQTRNNTL